MSTRSNTRVLSLLGALLLCTASASQAGGIGYGPPLLGSSSGGNVSTSGSPAAGNLAKFSDGTHITNGNISGDCTTSDTLVVTCAKTGGVPFTASATTDTTQAQNITGGTLPAARLPTPGTYQGGLVTVTPGSTSTEQMGGFAGTITPAYTGIVEICLAGWVTSSGVTAGEGAAWRPSYGTGTAPTANATLTGTQVGSQMFTSISSTAGSAGNIHLPIPSVCVIVTGLTVGTTYWLDAGVQALASTVQVIHGQISGHEIL